MYSGVQSLMTMQPAGGAGGNRQQVDNAYAAPAGNVQSNNDSYSHLQPLQKRIMEIVAQEDGDDGLHVSAVSRALGGQKGDDVM